MDSSLLVYDMERFLLKYTRFMTKNVYISFGMMSRFLEQYEYLYEELLRFSLLFRENLKYRKVMKIFSEKKRLVRLHNQKYLKKMCAMEEDFFDSLYSIEELDLQKRLLILTNEEEMLVVNDKNVIPLVVGKLKYLVERLSYKEDKLLVLCNNQLVLQELKQELLGHGLEKVKVETLDLYRESILRPGECVISGRSRYEYMVRYVTEKLFRNKERFVKFYQAFSKKIYLNKDYLEYDTFRDYHNYMYKRMFLKSGLSLKRYNEQEIKKRRSYLRTIYNETVLVKEEVDIANFLTLNGIAYNYDQGKFVISNNNKGYAVYFLKEEADLVRVEEDNEWDEVIGLKNWGRDQGKYLEQLVYELIKRRYPLERVSEEEVYGLLRDTTADSYFSEFITNTLVPAILYYKKNQSFKGTKLDLEQILEIEEIYDSYLGYLGDNKLLEQDDFLKRVSDNLVKDKYQYVITLGIEELEIGTNSMMIVDNYKEVGLLKENIKLLYDYKRYLHDNKVLPTLHTYLGYLELNELTRRFLRANLELINQKMVEVAKGIEVYFYEDANRLLVYREVMGVCKDILVKKDREETILIGLKKKQEINAIIGTGGLSKVDHKLLITEDKREVFYGNMLDVKQNYDTIVLPFLVVDEYHEDLLNEKGEYEQKVMLYVALSKCRKGVCLLVPNSKRGYLEEFLGNVGQVIVRN